MILKNQTVLTNYTIQFSKVYQYKKTELKTRYYNRVLGLLSTERHLY